MKAINLINAISNINVHTNNETKKGTKTRKVRESKNYTPLSFTPSEMIAKLSPLFKEVKAFDPQAFANAVLVAQEYGIRKNDEGLWLCSINAKMEKGKGLGVVNAGLELSGKLQGLCPTASRLGLSCREVCIVTTGNGRFPTVVKARIRRSNFLFEHTLEAMMLLWGDLLRLQFEAMLLGSWDVAFRFNTYSDLPWFQWKAIFAAFPNVNFYDYTKEVGTLCKVLPQNYTICYSINESSKEKQIRNWLDKGERAAIIYVGMLPSQHFGYPVINGDEHDLRYLDPKGSIAGLSIKGEGKWDRNKHHYGNGFILGPSK